MNPDARDLDSYGSLNLPAFSVRRRVTITMMILIVALFGVIFYFQLGLDLMPEIDFPLVSVVTQYEGVAPEDVENTVTRPIEEMMATIRGVRSVRSTSQEGVSVVQVEFGWDANLDFAAQDVRDKLDMVQDFLPDDASRPIVFKMDTGGLPLVVYVVTGLDDTLALRKYLEETITPRIERLEGIAVAMPFGGLVREIEVRVSHDELRKRGLSIDAVVAALRRENVNVAGGRLVRARAEHLIRTMGEFQSVKDIRDTVVVARGEVGQQPGAAQLRGEVGQSGSAQLRGEVGQQLGAALLRGGVRVLVSDVADVIDGHKEARQRVRANGRPAVLFMILKQSGANTVQAARRLRAELEAMRPRMPKGMEFHAVIDLADIVERVVSRTTANAFQGGVLAVAFIALFLWSTRATATIAVAIPLSVLTTFIGMYAIGYTFNLFTLAGLALGVGMLVDNAVVVIENTFRRLERGDEPALAACRGANEVSMAITASTLTTMSVFLPMVLVGGLAGKFSRPLALTVCVSLLASLFVAITLVPAIASTVFTGAAAGDYRRHFERGWFVGLRRRYVRALEGALAHPFAVCGVAALGFAGALVVLAGVGTDFTPTQDVPMSAMQVRMPVGTPLEETDARVRALETAAIEMPETTVVAAIVGPNDEDAVASADDNNPRDVNEAMLFMRLKYREERTRRSIDVEDALRAVAPRIPGSRSNFLAMGMLGMTTGAEQAPVAVRVFGPDLEELARLGREVEREMSRVAGLRDIKLGAREGKPELRIRLDRERAAEKGLSVFQVASTIRAAVLGVRATIFRERGEETTVRVRFRECDRDTLDKVRDITIPSPTGQAVKLQQVADIETGTGPLAIRREGRERKVAVTANVSGRDLGSVVADIKERVERIEFPQGYHVDYGGTYEDLVSTLRALFWAAIAAVFLVYMILAAQFESLVQPFIIMLTVPLGVIGVAFGLGVMGMSLSMPALLGACILVGIVVNNAIVMIDHMNRLRRDGREFRRAIVEGASDRLRPILVTSLTTILGILPMGFSRTQGGEMRAPLGISVAFGLAFGMALTLFVIPVVYRLLARRSIARMA